LVAAQLLGRRAIGIDTSHEALLLAEQRLRNPVRTESRLLERGRESYQRTDLGLFECLAGMAYHPVHRNKGIDAILAEEYYGKPVCLRIQRPGESVEDTAMALYKAAAQKGGAKLIVVVVEPQQELHGEQRLPNGVALVESTAAAIRNALSEPENIEPRSYRTGVKLQDTALM